MVSRKRADGLVGRARVLFREHPRLFVFPFLATAAATVVLAAGFVVVFGYDGGVVLVRLYLALGLPVEGIRSVLAYVLLFGFLGLGAVTVIWCNAALAHCTRQAVRGDTVSIRDGLRAALSATPVILVHGFAFALLGTLVAFTERHSDLAARLVAWLLGATYATLSMFVVPVAVFEDASVVETYSRSVHLVSERFDDAVTVTFGVFRSVMLLFLVPFIVSQVVVIVAQVTQFGPLLDLFDLVVYEHPLLVGGPIVYLVGMGVVFGSAYATVIKTALYLQITGAEPNPLVDNVEFTDATAETA